MKNFTNTLSNALTNKGYKVAIQEVTKNNNVHLTALQFRKGGGENVGINIYINGFYQEYLKGKDLEEILEEIITIYHSNKPPFESDYLMKMIQKKENYSIIIVNAKNNDLKNYIYREICNGELAEVLVSRFYINGERCSTKLKKEILPINYSEDEIFEIARENAKKGHIHITMKDVLRGMIGDAVDDIQPDNKMIVISNKDRVYGASTLTDTELLKEVSEKYFNNNNFFILPSSIHECICIEMDNLSYCKEMVRTINETEVDEEEVLSNEVFIFNTTRKIVEVAK